MDLHDAGIPPGATPGNDPTSAPADDRPRRGLIWAWALGAGLVAGLVGWLGGEATLDHFRISEEAAGRAFDFTQANVEKRITNSRNAAVAFGLLGGMLGLTLGMAAGLARGKPKAGLIGGVVGLVLGASAGGLIPFVVVPIYFDKVDPAQPTLLLPILINGAIWVPIGLASGLAFGIGLGGGGRRIGIALVGGLVGGVLATAAIELINATMFPLANSEQFIPSAGPYAGDEFDWEHFYLLRAGRSAAPAGPGEKTIDQFAVESAQAAAQQRLIGRFLVPLLVAAGIAWATQGPKRVPSKPVGQPAI